MKKYTYTLHDAFAVEDESIVNSIKALNDSTAPGLQWHRYSNEYVLVPDFLLPTSKVAGRWSKHDVESYGVSFEEWAEYVTKFGYEIVYH